MKTIVNIHEAKTQLSALIAAVEAGEEVVIARHGVPVVALVPHKAIDRQPGGLRELPGWENFKLDMSIFAPMTDAEVEEEGWL
jgi:prevent-host-death family protein